MGADAEFPTVSDDRLQATSTQRQAIHRLVINDADRMRELVRALTVAEADAVIDALVAAQRRTIVAS